MLFMKKERNKGGRPTLYTKKVFDEIYSRIADGESLKKICLEDNMPRTITFYRWLREEELCLLYMSAKQDRADGFAEEMVEIADDPLVYSTEQIAKARLRIDSRKWIAVKHYPKVYGDSAKLEVKDTSGHDAWVSNLRNDYT